MQLVEYRAHVLRLEAWTALEGGGFSGEARWRVGGAGGWEGWSLIANPPILNNSPMSYPCPRNTLSGPSTPGTRFSTT